MTVRLTVRREAWEAHLRATADAYGPGLVPVVKGNGYGFGRATLMPHASRLAHQVCVGTVHELADIPDGITAVVLTPGLDPGPAHPGAARVIRTVGNLAHLAPLTGPPAPTPGQPPTRVMVKLASSMRRYGATPDELPALLAAIERAGLQAAGFALHLPLAGDDAARLDEIEGWLPLIADDAGADVELWVSHLAPASFAALGQRHPTRAFRIRIGTALWHGAVKGELLRLDADVVHTRAVHAGETAGYFHAVVPGDGTLVAIGAGSAHGVAAHDSSDPARRSPFHFARTRLALLEAPHMHTSMVFVPRGDPCPQVGDRVDVQRPLIATLVDEVVWA
jgi:alanine racemase